MVKIIKTLQLASLFVIITLMNTNLVAAFATRSSPPVPCGDAYGQKPCILPAMPGQTPKCATHGSTFCEHVSDYPENLIKKLLKNYMNRDILADEAKIDYRSGERKGAHPLPIANAAHGALHNIGNIFGTSSSNHHFNNNFNNYNQHHGFQRPQQMVNQMPSKSLGYHYPRPNPTFQSLYLLKPPFPSQSSNYADYYRRAKREVQPFVNTNGTDDESVVNQFVSNIAPSNRTRRQTDEVNREQLCQVRTKYINPQAALNVRTGNWMYIVNGGEMATQLVRTEVCLSTECSNLCQLPNGYNSRCEQKYVQKRLVTVDPQGERLFTDTFWFPSCCVCTLSNSSNT